MDNSLRYLELNEIFDIKTGYTPSTKNPEFWNNGTVLWFKMHDLINNGMVLNNSILKINQKAVKSSGLYQANSIILATTATIGVHALITKPFLCNQQFSVFQVKDKYRNQVAMEFYNHYFYVIDEWCKNNVNLSAFPSVKMDELKKLKIPVPDLSVQKQIAATLDKFNELTNELTNQLNLRNQQYQYYLEHLMDFANANHPLIKDGGGVIRKIPLGEIVEFKIGDIIKNLSILKHTTGLDTGLYYIVSSAIKPIGKWNQFNHQGQTITITKDGACGNVAWQENRFWATEHSIVLINKSNQIIGKYLYYYLKANEFALKELKIQSAPDFIRISDLKAFKIEIPPLAIQKQIVAALDQLNKITSDLTIGLPAGIKQAQKQYWYYLEALMKF